MAKDFKEFEKLMDSDEMKKKKDELYDSIVARFEEEDGNKNAETTISGQIAVASRYAQDVARLELREYHEWVNLA